MVNTQSIVKKGYGMYDLIMFPILYLLYYYNTFMGNILLSDLSSRYQRLQV